MQKEYRRYGSMIGLVGQKAICKMLDGTTTDAPELEISSKNWHTMINEADLIVESLNACIEINPENPQVVAENITTMYEALKIAKNQIEYLEEKYPKTGTSMQTLVVINDAFNKIGVKE